MNSEATNVDHGYTARMVVILDPQKELEVEKSEQISSAREYLKQNPFTEIIAQDTTEKDLVKKSKIKAQMKNRQEEKADSEHDRQ